MPGLHPAKECEMSVRMTRSSIPTFAAFFTLAAVAGCTVHLAGSDGGTQTPPPSAIAVRITNDTGKPLDPQLYIGPAAGGSAGLFIPANKRTDFGFGGLGLLEAGAAIEVTIPCDPAVLIGTAGGIFGDNLATPTGQGQPLVLDSSLNVPCGNVLTFTFTANGNALKISYSVAPS
jgi:hypothetical protein